MFVSYRRPASRKSRRRPHTPSGGSKSARAALPSPSPRLVRINRFPSNVGPENAVSGTSEAQLQLVKDSVATASSPDTHPFPESPLPSSAIDHLMLPQEQSPPSSPVGLPFKTPAKALNVPSSVSTFTPSTPLVQMSRASSRPISALSTLSRTSTERRSRSRRRNRSQRRPRSRPRTALGIAHSPAMSGRAKKRPNSAMPGRRGQSQVRSRSRSRSGRRYARTRRTRSQIGHGRGHGKSSRRRGKKNQWVRAHEVVTDADYKKFAPVFHPKSRQLAVLLQDDEFPYRRIGTEEDDNQTVLAAPAINPKTGRFLLRRQDIEALHTNIDEEIDILNTRTGESAFRSFRLRNMIMERQRCVALFGEMLQKVDGVLSKYEDVMAKQKILAEKTLSAAELGKMIMDHGSASDVHIVERGRLVLEDILQRRGEVSEERKDLHRYGRTLSAKFSTFGDETETVYDDDDLLEIVGTPEGSTVLSRIHDSQKSSVKTVDEIGSLVEILRTHTAFKVLRLRDVFGTVRTVLKNSSDELVRAMQTNSSLESEVASLRRLKERSQLQIQVIRSKLLEKDKEIAHWKLLFLQKTEELQRVVKRVQSNQEEDGGRIDSGWVLEGVARCDTSEEERQAEESMLSIFDPRMCVARELHESVDILNKPTHLKLVAHKFVEERETVVRLLDASHEKLHFLLSSISALNKSRDIDYGNEEFFRDWQKLSNRIDREMGGTIDGETDGKTLDDEGLLSSHQMTSRQFEHILDENAFERLRRDSNAVFLSIRGKLLKVFFEFRYLLFGGSPEKPVFRKGKALKKLSSAISSRVLHPRRRKQAARKRFRKIVEGARRRKDSIGPRRLRAPGINVTAPSSGPPKNLPQDLASYQFGSAKRRSSRRSPGRTPRRPKVSRDRTRSTSLTAAQMRGELASRLMQT